MKFPHTYCAIPTSRNETRVVIKPLNAADFTRMFLKSILWRTLGSIELVNCDSMLIGAGKQMTSIGESDFTT